MEKPSGPATLPDEANLLVVSRMISKQRFFFKLSLVSLNTLQIQLSIKLKTELDFFFSFFCNCMFKIKLKQPLPFWIYWQLYWRVQCCFSDKDDRTILSSPHSVKRTAPLQSQVSSWLCLRQPRRSSQRELAFTTPVTLHKTPCHSSTARMAALALMETLTSSDRVFI